MHSNGTLPLPLMLMLPLPLDARCVNTLEMDQIGYVSLKKKSSDCRLQMYQI